MYRLVTSIETRTAFSGTLVFSKKLTPVLLLSVEGVCLQMQTASRSDHHIQILWVFQPDLVCEIFVSV